MSKNGENGYSPPENRVVLNVGGIKFETYRTTLTAFPETFLGTMFAPRNEALLRNTNDNEYFFDRNPRAFYYIMEYYRTGKVYWGDYGLNGPKISRKQLEAEYDYFQIHPENHILAPTRGDEHDAATRLDEFVNMLASVLEELRANFRTRAKITFPALDSRKLCVRPDLKILCDLVQPFSLVGYHFLRLFGDEIGKHLETKISTLECRCVLKEGSGTDDEDAACTIIFTMTHKLDVELIKNLSVIANTNINELTDMGVNSGRTTKSSTTMKTRSSNRRNG
ncbi:hypothetical protein G9A89_002208 [Geosiphon pyriformis]|nr:hypothetical protein G9A89_002208 [Geosiphon pyriformis]